MSRRVVVVLLATVVLALVLSAQARAQNARPNPADFQTRMEQRMKDTLGVTDDEWKALKPKVDKVQTLLRQTRTGGGAFMGRRPGTDPNAAPAADAPEVDKKMADLQKLLQNKDSKDEDITAALTALRDARAKAKEELAKAQKDLLDGLTPRRVGALVTLGIVDP